MYQSLSILKTLLELTQFFQQIARVKKKNLKTI